MYESHGRRAVHFLDGLSVTLSYLLRERSMQESENECSNAEQAFRAG